MVTNAYVSNHLFGNRLYIGEGSPEDVKKQIYLSDLDKIEYEGAGVRSYSKLIGWLLSKIRFSMKVEINRQIFYVNKKSLAKKGCIAEVADKNAASKKATFEQIDKLYKEYKSKNCSKDELKAYDQEIEKTIKKFNYFILKFPKEIIKI